MCTGFHVKIIFCRMQTKGTSTWPRLEKGAHANSEMAYYMHCGLGVQMRKTHTKTKPITTKLQFKPS